MPHSRATFQGNPTHEQVLRAQLAKWRQLESGVRLALKGQGVQVVYHNNELIINDTQKDANKVWSALKSIANKYSFAVALKDTQPVNVNGEQPLLLWINDAEGNTDRTWTIRQTL